MGIFVWDFLWQEVYMVPLACDNGMVPRYWDWRFWHRAMPLMSAQADINQH